MMALSSLLSRLFGSQNDRSLAKLRPLVTAINQLEPTMAGLDDQALAAKTAEFRQRLAAGETEDKLLPEAFAVVREASKRVLGLRHFDVQLMGGIVLHQGQIAEMRTGEGKTLVATLPTYLNALSGKGVHVVTVNDYLAKRDSGWMGLIHQFLGLSVGVIVPGLDDYERQMAYRCDVTYGTNNEFGFDYLRDNLKMRQEELAHRPFHYAIVDEVDSVLIDEARTPLIISGQAENASEKYQLADQLVLQLTPEDFELDEKQRSVSLTEKGQEHAEALLQQQGVLAHDTGLYDVQNISLVHHINQALRAHKNFTLDKDYIIREGKVVIIDEFTGRMMEGRRYSDGLHQALEAKEHVEIQMENQTLAQITFQNYFRMYPKLAGMTGTAMTEAGEFDQIYRLTVIDIPTNREMVRQDRDDEVYRTSEERDEAVLAEIKRCHEQMQPVLVGTVSIEKSESLSQKLHKANIPHNVLNARHHAKEAAIIAEAGIPGAVTIATNMAGRGTDIQLGGNLDMRLSHLAETLGADNPAYPQEQQKIRDEIATLKQQALAAGGLMVIGTERHESRRIDNQLRGRSGRQGDPGASQFYVSLEDDLMRIFGSERLDSMLVKLGLQQGEAIVHPWVSKALETAQKKVEARNFEIRKQLLRFDDVMNDQRKAIFEQRHELMASEDVSSAITTMRHETIEEAITSHMPDNSLPDQWDIKGLHSELLGITGLDLPLEQWIETEGNGKAEILAMVKTAADDHMAQKEVRYGAPLMRHVERSLLLQILDNNWKDHLQQLDHLRQGIGLRAYAQRDPLNEYKQEAFTLFGAMLERLKQNITQTLAHIEIRAGQMADTGEEAAAPLEPFNPPPISRQEHRGLSLEQLAAYAEAQGQDQGETANLLRSIASPDIMGKKPPAASEKIPRNAPCPCGSGKKYKQCHGKSG